MYASMAVLLLPLYSSRWLISKFILQADKFLKCDWPRPVVFKRNLKYLHVKITPVT